MKVFVTGGAGFIGSAVVREALGRDLAVVNFDKLTYAANLENLKGFDDRPGYAFVRGDIGDAEAVRAALETHQPDAIMHLAAESHVDRSIDGPGAFIETNIVGTFALLNEARRYFETLSAERAARFRFHHVSTDEVYGALGATGRFSEETPYRPNSPYSASKAASDFLARAWCETYGLPVVTSNCSNNYGPYQFPEKLIPVVTLAALEGKPIPVYGKGENVRDWLFVDDHADALLAVLTRGAVGETYNIGGDAERANIDLVRTICAIMDDLRPDGAPHDRLIEFVADRPGHDLRYAIDAGKIARELDWRPCTDLNEGLRATVAWYLGNRAWWEGVRARGFDGARIGLENAPNAAE
ncbi:MAG: dTDP-glucose 4,6-dehydratase [Parvularculaceae bacterium]